MEDYDKLISDIKAEINNYFNGLDSDGVNMTNIEELINELDKLVRPKLEEYESMLSGAAEFLRSYRK